jgi:hypothetical protein
LAYCHIQDCRWYDKLINLLRIFSGKHLSAPIVQAGTSQHSKQLEEIALLEKKLSLLPNEQQESGKGDRIREEILRLSAEIEEIKPNPHPSRKRYNS